MKKFLILLSLLCGYCVFAQAPEEGRPNRPKEYLPDNTNPPEQNAVYGLNTIDTPPEFPGGMNALHKFLSDNYNMPAEAGVTGKVIASFTVERNGKLSNIKAVRDPGKGFGEELARVLKLSPKWKPGTLKGKKVRVAYYVTYVIPSKD
jgi:protein TonB